MEKNRIEFIRKQATATLELTKGFTPEQRKVADNVFHTMEELAGYILELTSAAPTGTAWVRASEFKTTAPVYRPYRRKREDGEFDYGEIYVTEDAGDVFLDVDNENTYEPSSFEKWNDYDILFEPNI